jgi:ribosome biogenesis GTPase / thiamine phosphate phosphatase
MSTLTSHGLDFAQLGWTADRVHGFVPHTAAGLVPGRVVSGEGDGLAITEAGPAEVIIQRRFARETASSVDMPVVGDWLALQPLSEHPRQAALREVLPRRSAFVRHRPADGRAQVLAANVDTAFLVSGLDHDLNLRRIERYLVLALDGGVTPVVVLNKVDIALDQHRAVAEVHAIASGTRVIITSALDGTGLDEIRAFLEPGSTACLLGSSGVGKSTLTNALLGAEVQVTHDLRGDDSKGRHTTTHRELFAVPDGGLLIDTPGLRTVGVMGDAESVSSAFDEVSSLALGCRFSDCRHEGEPGCAVNAAIDCGALAPDRLASHRKLEAERRHAELQADDRARRQAERQRGRHYRHVKDELKRRKGMDY